MDALAPVSFFRGLFLGAIVTLKVRDVRKNGPYV